MEKGDDSLIIDEAQGQFITLTWCPETDLRIKLEVNQCKVQFLVDTGATRSTLRSVEASGTPTSRQFVPVIGAGGLTQYLCEPVPQYETHWTRRAGATRVPDKRLLSNELIGMRPDDKTKGLNRDPGQPQGEAKQREQAHDAHADWRRPALVRRINSYYRSLQTVLKKPPKN
ncbi:hypothetical protein AGIG_G12846 [Arapaima gigas]